MAGAGLRMVVAPRARPARKALVTASSGTSSWQSTTSAEIEGGSDHRGVGTRDHHDAVLTVVIDSDQRPAGRHIDAVDELREVDAFNLGN